MIEIFKTGIRHKESGKQVLMAIKQQLPGVVATLDLEDKDHVLRVVGVWDSFQPSKSLNWLNSTDSAAKY